VDVEKIIFKVPVNRNSESAPRKTRGVHVVQKFYFKSFHLPMDDQIKKIYGYICPFMPKKATRSCERNKVNMLL